jgi:hypothetical protein
MRPWPAVLLLVIAPGLPALPGLRQSAGIGQLAWLKGCWEAAGSGRSVEEQWTAPKGGSMIGVSRTVRGDSLVAYEFVLLRERGDRLVYQAHPSGQPSAEFVSSVVSADSVIFENPAHDFPQRVGYRRNGDRLLGWIDGTRNGQARRAEFPYRRTACPAN